MTSYRPQFPSVSLLELARQLYSEFGQSKPMGAAASHARLPHFFLLRRMFAETDLLVILNTQRCRYRCSFCELPDKASLGPVSSTDIQAQFADVLTECRHGLAIVDRVTLANEGSVLDRQTLPVDALDAIVLGINEMRRTRRIVIETRLEFVDVNRLRQLSSRAPRTTLDILTGFETLDESIRSDVLGKGEPLPAFLAGLDQVAAIPRATITCYVIVKPSPSMTDHDAVTEALSSVDYLAAACAERRLKLAIRLNPMYAARGSRWFQRATPDTYAPPRLTDVLTVARAAAARHIPTYIGLSTEGLAAEGGDYTAREDYSRDLLKEAIAFNLTQRWHDA